jgi:hypothetical protein
MFYFCRETLPAQLTFDSLARDVAQIDAELTAKVLFALPETNKNRYYDYGGRTKRMVGCRLVWRPVERGTPYPILISIGTSSVLLPNTN